MQGNTYMYDEVEIARFRCSRSHGFDGSFLRGFREHLADAALRLPRPLFIFNQRKSHMPVAVVAEAYAGGDGGFGFGEQELRELKRIRLPVLAEWSQSSLKA